MGAQLQIIFNLAPRFLIFALQKDKVRSCLEVKLCSPPLFAIFTYSALCRLSGCVAGDEESYTEFEDFMDKVIEFRHNGYTKDKTHKTDLNPGMCITLTSLTVLLLLELCTCSSGSAWL